MSDANPGEVTAGFATITYMQDLTYEICANDARYGESGKLIDSRDNKIYWVAKLRDGNCWMTQNLDYNDPNSTRITNPSSWTDTSANYRAYYDPGTKVVSGTSLVDAGSSDTHLLIGNYYSWQSATNGTGSSATSAGAVASSSICPSGWQLPTSNSTTANGSFGNLTEKYAIGNNAAGSTALRSAPFYFQFGGGVWSGSLSNAGNSGYYWSSTAIGSDYAYILYFDSSSVNPSRNWYRYFGMSVRCLVQGS